MTTLALASVKASPGVTTTALAIAAAAVDDADAIVAELDPHGGDIAAWFGLPFEPGLISLAAAARRPVPPPRPAEYCQRVLGGVSVLIGPAAGERAESAMQLLTAQGVWRLLAADDTVVLADCGRLGAGSLAAAVIQASSGLAVVCRPTLNELQHVHASLPRLRELSRDVSLVLIGDGPYRPTEVASSLDVDVLGRLPVDGRAARMLRGEPASRRAAARLPLLRAAGDLGRQLKSTFVATMESQSLTESVASSRLRDRALPAEVAP